MKYKRILLLALSLLLALGSAGCLWIMAEEGNSLVGQPVDASKVTVYNNSPSSKNYPVVYVRGLDGDKNNLDMIRVYDSGGNLLGAGRELPLAFMAAVPLEDYLNKDGGTLYITNQYPGMEESAKTEVRYGKQINPQIDFKAYLLGDSFRNTDTGNVNYDLTTPMDDANFLAYETSLDRCYTGDVVKISVMFNDFSDLSAIELPIHYDTRYLELLTWKAKPVGGEYRPMIDKTPADSGAEGYPKNDSDIMNVMTSTVNGSGYAVFLGDNFTDWDGAEYGATRYSPYVNTDTGYIKFSAYVNGDRAPFWSVTENKPVTSANVFSMYFRYKGEQGMAADDLIRFATAADCPEEYLGTGTAQERRYYDPYSPYGAEAYIGYASVIHPPISLSEGQSVNPVKVPPVNNLAALSEHLEKDTIPNGTVKVYNLTNSPDNTNSYAGLDADRDDYVYVYGKLGSDQLKSGDRIIVQQMVDAGGVLTKVDIGSGTVSGDLVCVISVGKDKLSPDGGAVLISRQRGAQAPTTPVSVTYPKESGRTLRIEVAREDVKKDTDSRCITGTSAEVSAKLSDIKQDEKIQLRVYFNDINDFMMFVLPIYFNSKAMMAADKYFDPVSTGTLTEREFKNGTKGLIIGDDLAELTFNDYLIHSEANGKTDAEIEAMLADEDSVCYGKSLEEIKQICAAVELKTGMGTPVGDSAAVWNGGLIFTGRSDDDTSGYPYILNNENSPDSAGLIKLAGATLNNTGITLEKDGKGYNFLKINFVGNALNTNPQIHIATKSDAVYDEAHPNGASLTLKSAPYTGDNNMPSAVSMPVTEEWAIVPLGDIEIPEKPERGIIGLVDGDGKVIGSTPEITVSDADKEKIAAEQDVISLRSPVSIPSGTLKTDFPLYGLKIGKVPVYLEESKDTAKNGSSRVAFVNINEWDTAAMLDSGNKAQITAPDNPASPPAEQYQSYSVTGRFSQAELSEQNLKLADGFTPSVEARVCKSPTRFAYGNSPYGLIMSDSNLNYVQKAEYKEKFEENHNRFINGYTPANGFQNVYYDPDAWESVNYDKDETALFAYSGHEFTDTGITMLCDSQMNEITDLSVLSSVKRTLKVNIMTAENPSDMINDFSTINTVTLTLPDGISPVTTDVLKGQRVRPDIYYIEYTYQDYDGSTLTVKRPIIILPQNGDVNVSGAADDTDAEKLKSRFRDILPYNNNLTDYTSGGRLYKYRVCDVNNDGDVNAADANLIKHGRTPVRYY